MRDGRLSGCGVSALLLRECGKDGIDAREARVARASSSPAASVGAQDLPRHLPDRPA